MIDFASAMASKWKASYDSGRNSLILANFANPAGRGGGGNLKKFEVWPLLVKFGLI